MTAIVKYRRKSRKSKGGKVRKYQSKGNTGHMPYKLVNMGNGMPLKVRMVHRYAEYPTMTFTSGAFAQYAFSANGLYDPNVTGAGIQPMYFDTMTALYNHYTVIGAKIRVTFLPTAVPAVPLTVGILIDDNGTLVNNNIAACQENPTSKWVTIPAGDNANRTITYTWSAKKTFGGTAMIPDLQGNAATNPTEQSYFTLFGQVMTGSTTQSVLCQVDIEYITIWTELIQPNYS